MAIVILTMKNGEKAFFGPFKDGDEATKWGFENCKGFEWCWDEVYSIDRIEEAKK